MLRPVGGPAPRVGGPVQNGGGLPRPVGGPVKPAKPMGSMPSYKKGGVVKKTGPALVHKGEKVIPVKKSKSKKK